MNRLSLRYNRLKFKTAGKLPIVLEEFIEYTPKGNTGGRQHVTPVGLAKHWDLNRLCPKISPITEWKWWQRRNTIIISAQAEGKKRLRS